MKNKIMKLALLLACGVLTPVAANAASPLTQDHSLANSVIYLKAESNNKWNKDQIEPDFGLGYRYHLNHHGIDISATGRWGEFNADDGEFIHLGTQANYLYYFTPGQGASFYAGIGLGNDHTRFNAEEEKIKHQGRVNALATFGYQHGLNDTFSTFVQAQASQSATTYVNGGEFTLANAWQPTLTFSAGIGF